ASLGPDRAMDLAAVVDPVLGRAAHHRRRTAVRAVGHDRAAVDQGRGAAVADHPHADRDNRAGGMDVAGVGDVDVAVAVGIDAERGALVARRRDAAGIVDDRLAEVRGRHRADALVDAVDDDAASRVGLYKRLVQAVGVGTEGVEAAGIDVAGVDHAAVDAAHQGTVGDAVGRIHGDAAGVLDDRLPDGCPGERARRDATAALD